MKRMSSKEIKEAIANTRFNPKKITPKWRNTVE